MLRVSNAADLYQEPWQVINEFFTVFKMFKLRKSSPFHFILANVYALFLYQCAVANDVAIKENKDTPTSNPTGLDGTSANITYLRQDTNFNRDYTGVVFSVYDQRRDLFSPYSELELEPVMELIAKTFSNILIPLEDASIDKIPILLYELKTIKSLQGKVSISIMLMPNLHINAHYIRPIQDSAGEYGFNGDLISTFIVPCCDENTSNLADIVQNKVLGNRNPSTYTFGYALNISICTPFVVVIRTEDDFFDEAISLAQTLFVYFEEDEENVKLSASRMFQQRVETFEKCKAFLARRDPSRTKAINFLMIHYATNLKFSSSPESLENFVRYWEMLSEWAGKTKTNVILGNAIDGSRTFKDSRGTGIETRVVSEIGWWKYQELRNNNNSTWIDKKKEALRLAITKQEKANEKNKQGATQPTTTTSSLSAGQIVLIGLLPLFAAIVLVALGLYVIHRYYQETYITNGEMDDFFNGDEFALDAENGTEGVYKMAYDKSRFEVDPKSFSIEIEGKLGSGEFGLVCRGTIQDERGAVNAAVKMVNPQKFKKTTLSGLLSEIKVLAYVGKHDNITELLGANTSDLKNGKVFIFLELCHLGSLEKYLRKVNPEINQEDVAEMETDSNDGNMYVNTEGGTSRPLDALLSDDLYEWSQQICNGMAYLATKHVVHADLATRNVLLNLRKEAKICDFGLSRRMYNYTNYVKEKQEPLPWKWMAPESLKLSVFNEKTDVWAYGVTLWEIYSLGETPYPGLSWDQNFSQMLQLGFRLTEPQYNDQDMFSFMKLCWESNPDKRPTFTNFLGHFKTN